MFKFVVLVSLAVCAYGGFIPSGLVPQLDGRIVGGVDVSIDQAPFMASLQNNNAHFCGGSLIAEDRVLTAAHCVTNGAPKLTQLRLGSADWSVNGETVGVKKIVANPNYNPDTMVNDVAVVCLSRKVSLGSAIKLITLANTNPSVGSNAQVYGWGTTKSGASSIPKMLKGVTVQINSQDACNKSYGGMITNSMICASATGKDSCQGDSGGPLVSGNQQVGVVSWGYGCAQQGYPGVYADVPNLLGWINSVQC